jgi:hypothetical protein
MADVQPTGVQKFLQAISTYENEFTRWEKRCTKIIKRYRDDTRTQSGNETVKFNILWSNVQTLIPAVYAKLPKASAKRRFGDRDQIGRVAAQLIERALDYEIEHYPDFRATMKYAVEDRFLGGRGVAWVRYEPHVRAQELALPEDGAQVTEDVDEDGNLPEGAEMPEEIEYECAPVDYVHWKDFGHSSARTWEEVTQVWRWVYMTREALVERFGEDMGIKIPLDSGPDNLDGPNRKREGTRAKICELWCKETQKVYWLHKGMAQFVDERDDPLGLEGFYPCPKPLYATTTSDSLVPVPDFVLYQDQANELDILSDRIDGLVKSLRVRGVYDASQPALQRLMTEGDNNSLIPVDKWMAFGEKGGLKGSIDLLPLDTLAAALMQCYQARDNIKRFAQPVVPGLFWDDGLGYAHRALQHAVVLIHTYSDFVQEIREWSCNYDARELRARLEDGRLNLYVLGQGGRSGVIRQGTNGFLRSERVAPDYIAYTYWGNIHFTSWFRLHAALADLYFWWAWRCLGYAQEVSGSELDTVVGMCAARAAMAEIAFIASVIVHEYGHVTGSLYHCNNAFAQQDCCQDFGEWIFLNRVGAELALPEPHHPCINTFSHRGKTGKNRFLLRGAWSTQTCNGSSGTNWGPDSCADAKATFTHEDLWTTGHGLSLSYHIPEGCTRNAAVVSGIRGWPGR